MLVLGMMSGTSADGMDVALARISGAPPNLNTKLLGHTSKKFPPALRREILRIAEQQSISAGELSQLNFRLGELFAAAALSACRTFRVPPSRVALIGSHGQTIFHQGRPIPYFGSPTASTLQIGEPSVIAARTGITTVGDFRPADIALGGQGAPLVPYADYLLYRHEKFGRVSLNLGGIANITVLPRAAKPQQVFAFDTGPANMLIDALVKHFTRGRPGLPKNFPAAAQAPTPARAQSGEIRAGQSLHDRNARPIRLQFIGQNHRERRPHALPHFRFANCQCNCAFFVDPNPSIWLKFFECGARFSRN